MSTGTTEPGRFIVLEGVEGVGKTTQARILAETLRAKGREVVETLEPGGTSLGRALRQILLDPERGAMDPTAELLLMAAARAQHVSEVIRPALERGAVVVCDRFSDATVAYQGHGRGIALETIDTVNAAATGGLCPDLVIILNVDVELGLKRNHAARKEDRFEQESLAFHRKVQAGYREAAKSRGRILVSGEGTVEDVAGRIRKVIEERLGL